MTNTDIRPTTSITRELAKPASELRQMIRPYQPTLEMWRRQTLGSLSGRPWIRPKRTRMAWMSGHAIDYRIRWWLTGVDALPGPVLAGLAHCDLQTTYRLLDAFGNVAGSPPGELEPALERSVCTLAIAAASVEPLFRAGMVPCALADLGWDEFVATHLDVLDDVVELSRGLPALIGRYATSPIDCGTVTGIGRLGGDADFVAGDELVEIKCVVNPRASATRALQQLLVYSARIRPSSAALMLPRQHTTVRFDLSNLGQGLAELNDAICSTYGGLG